VAADITKDGRFLLVANHLHAGRADQEQVAATVSVLDLVADAVVKELSLPNGSGVVKEVRISPDGKYAVVTHLVASFNRAASQVAFGWMNANALTIIDIEKMETRYTVLLDSLERGAANPWGAAWSTDGGTLVVAHSGTHEVSVIDFPKLLAGLERLAAPENGRDYQRRDRSGGGVLRFVSRYEGLVEGLPFLVGARQRVKLPEGDLGPRAVVVAGRKAYVANYFSDTLSVIDLGTTPPGVESVRLEAKAGKDPFHWVPDPSGARQTGTQLGTPWKASLPGVDPVRRGEFYFYDATLCRQGWQSCASCHPGEARADGLNWDLLNDGIGNPKNTKSLLFAHRTPSAMSLGVRETAESAVRSGIRNILFTEQPEEVASAIDEYLKSLRPVPSPYLVQKDEELNHGKHGKHGMKKEQEEGTEGRLSQAAERGAMVFERAGCAECHPPPLFTDLHRYDVGTRRAFDKPTDRFDTPSLIELWRTAPYLHDGSAATVRDVLTTRNAKGQHGQASGLSKEEINDLCAYLLSL
jgi:DNA-binding beta-propeller fold protein YncE